VAKDAIDRIVHEWNRQRPDLDVSVTHVLQRITRLYLLQSASFAKVFGRFGITFGEWEVLSALFRSGPPYRLRPTQLVRAMVLSSGAMTNRIDNLEDLRLVERLRDTNDRRSIFVALTKRGHRLLDEAVVAHLANEERLVGALSPGERRQLSNLLRKLLVSEPFVSLDPIRSLDVGGNAPNGSARPLRPRRR
jgi:DNA-binding MarR family transcriptional regulator